MSTVVVTGATGTLGREVVTRLLARQHRTRILTQQASPSAPHGVEAVFGDLASGRGVREAVAGVDAIIHCATSVERVQQVDVEGTRALLQAAYASGSPHIVYISIVGVDRTAYCYYQGKYETELLIEQGPLPWTVVRATQLHPFVLQIIRSLGADTLPEVPVPAGVRFQSIDVGEVADRLVSFMEQGPAGHAPDIGGPQVLTVEEMTEAYLRIQGNKATVSAKALPGDRYDAFRSGINLAPDHAVGAVTWVAFLRHLYSIGRTDFGFSSS
jgi:uncharacterized protein YbjT (DUF2867 family)